MEDEVDGEELTLTKSLKVNVLGQPRKNPVPLPTGIKGGRPGAIPNIKVGGPGQINACHRKNPVDMLPIHVLHSGIILDSLISLSYLHVSKR